jgi:AraC family transcriptional regulator, reactive chlorine species (RCS)-specific activator of rcl operon
MKLNENMIPISSGGCILFTPGFSQWYGSSTVRYVDSFLHFDCDEISYLIDKYDIPTNCVFYPREDAFIKVGIKEIEYEFFLKDHFWKENIDGLFLRFLSLLGRSLAVNRTYSLSPRKAEMFQRFQTVRLNILSKLEYQWTLKEMADLANLCPSRFCIFYKQFFSISPRLELINARIDKAKYLLTNKAHKVSEVAELAGYNNTFHFIRQFKKITGVSPTKYHD